MSAPVTAISAERHPDTAEGQDPAAALSHARQDALTLAHVYFERMKRTAEAGMLHCQRALDDLNGGGW